jgi:hypothetical protein
MPRDELVMPILAEQWVMDFATLQRLCGTRRRRTYKLIERWRDDFGLIRSTSIVHRGSDHEVTVVWPRQTTATTFLRYPAAPWSPTATNLAHKLAVTRLRVALCGLQPGVWVPERRLLREAALAEARLRPAIGPTTPAGSGRWVAPSVHVHDGRVLLDSRWWSIEVELTVKMPVARLASVVLAAYQSKPDTDGLLYVYGVDRVGAAVTRAVKGLIAAEKLTPVPGIRIRSLTDVLAARSINLPTTTTPTFLKGA